MALPPDTRPVFSGACLVVESVGPQYILAMKLAAARPEDLADCAYLIAELGIGTHDELLDLIEQALRPPRTRTPKMSYFAQDALEAAESDARKRRISRWLNRVRRTRSRSQQHNAARQEPPQATTPRVGKDSVQDEGTPGHAAGSRQTASNTPEDPIDAERLRDRSRTRKASTSVLRRIKAQQKRNAASTVQGKRGRLLRRTRRPRCGKWMPQARRHCTGPQKHHGQCR